MDMAAWPAENKMSQLFPKLKTLLRGIGGLSPSCKEAARLQSAALDRALTPVESYGLRFHIVFCKWCRVYGRQIKFLRSAARAQPLHEAPPSTPPALSGEARQRIKRSLQRGAE
jgi:hypothetical protein